MTGEPLRLKIEAAQWFVPERFRVRGDHRRLAYRLKSIRWEHPPYAVGTSPETPSGPRAAR
jgi:hypothetical protein